MPLLPTPPLLVDATPPVTLPSLEKRILWATAAGYGDRPGNSDSDKFPGLTAIKARRSACPPEALSEFVEAARMARDRILVLDDYLFKPQKSEPQQTRLDQILLWFPDGLVANEIRILTNSLGDEIEQGGIQKQFDERIESINQRAPRRAGKAKIEIRFSLGSRFGYVHDRFAIIDNELWHFGATVGGLHNLVNAATRGWDADACDAIRFFDDAWKGDSDAQYRS